MAKLALNGGVPVRQKPFPSWPEVAPDDEAAVLEVVRSGRWWMYAYSSTELAGEGTEGGSRVEAFERAFAPVSARPPRAHHDQRIRRPGDRVPGRGSEARRRGHHHTVYLRGLEFVHPQRVRAPGLRGHRSPELQPQPGTGGTAITPRTRAILPVHFGGNIADMTRLCEIARRHNLFMIEDSAQAQGASLQGNRWAGNARQYRDLQPAAVQSPDLRRRRHPHHQ